MSPRDHDRAGDLFLEARELPSDERTAFLDRVCGAEDALRAEVESLLAADARASMLDNVRGFDLRAGLRDLAEETRGSAEDLAEEVPEQIGPYRVIGKIGQGGMGAVYEAEQEYPNRRVALKVLRPGMVTPSLVKRLQREAHILGQLQHSGIAQIYDAGFAESSSPGAPRQPYLAMELVRGLSLDEFAAAHDLGARARMELVAHVCDALHYAHQRGIIHRDLKPTNILVDDSGQPKILDFGVARATDADMQSVTLQTDVGQLVGTLSYMSPEQTAGDSRDLDGRSDVYALGVMLHELLAGELPCGLRNVPIPEAARAIREVEPTRLGSIDTRYRGDVETIVTKALEKDRARRYQSAADLATDIRRFLADEPILARPVSTFYQLRKFARRNKGLVTGVLVAFVTLIAAVVGLSWEATREVAARRMAERAAYRAHLSAAAAAIREQDVPTAENHLMHCVESRRGWEWRHLRGQLDQSWHAVSLGHAFDRDVRAQFAFDNAARGVRFLWLPRHGPLMVRTEGFAEPSACSEWVITGVVSASLTHDGRSVLTIDETGKACFADATTGSLEPPIPSLGPWPDEPIRLINFYKDVPLAAVQRVLSSLSPLETKAFVCFSPDAARMALSCGTAISVWDLSATQEVCELAPHPEGADGLAFSPDGHRLATAGRDRKVRLFDLEHAGVLVWDTPRGHTDAALTVAFSPNGELIASGGQDRVIRLWDAQTGESRGELIGHDRTIMGLAFSPDGHRVVSADNESLREWDVGAVRDPRVLRGHSYQVRTLAISPDGVLLASGGRELCLWDVPTGELVAVFPFGSDDDEIVQDLSLAADGKRLAVALNNAGRVATVLLVDLRTGKHTELARAVDEWTNAVAFSPSGDQLAAVIGRELCFWDATTHKLLTRLPESPLFIAYGPDGKLLATSESGGVRVYDARSFEVYRDLPNMHGAGLAFSPSGMLLAIGGKEPTVFDVASGRRLATLRGHTDEVYAVAFLPDGSRMATGSNDRTIRLWDLNTFEEVTQLRGHVDQVNDLAFTPDGNTLLSCSGDYTMRVWDTRPLSSMLIAKNEYTSVAARLTPRIRGLLEQLGDALAAVRKVDADATLTPRERQIAGQLILQEAMARRGPTP